MSDPQPGANANSGANGGSSGASSASGTTAGAAGANAKPPRPEFRHPVLTAMGIPRLRVPSRNWLIFWAVTGTIAGAIYYDRTQAKKRRDFWKDQVRPLSTQQMSPLEMPRKVTVYITPPPGDYIDVSLGHFRKYVKPILVASATDYEIKTGSRQGEIRHQVAEQIRNRRRKELGLPEVAIEGIKVDDELDQQIVAKLEYDSTGGVICIGRGSYKEYMNGLHEGWLGPLDKPAGLDDDAESSQAGAQDFPDRNRDMADIQGYDMDKYDSDRAKAEAGTVKSEGHSSLSDSLAAPMGSAAVNAVTGFSPIASTGGQDKSEGSESDQKDGSEPGSGSESESVDKDKEEEKKAPVPKPYVPIGEWSQAQSPAEFLRAQGYGTEISQPIAIIPFPHVLGFLRTPTRTYRYFTRRHLADSLGEATAAVVFATTQPYDMNQTPSALVREEDDWPTKWKKEGIEKGSEWMLPFAVDDRIGESMTIYPDKVIRNQDE